jgi:hypothetical protein
LSVEVAIDEHGCPVLRSASPHLSLAFFRPPALEEVVLMVGLSAYKRIG